MLLAGDDTTRSALYTIDPLSGAATEVVQFELPFEPDDIRFVPGTNGQQLRITELVRSLPLPRTVIVEVPTGVISGTLEIDAGQELGTRPGLTAFDYTDTEMFVITGTGIDGYVQHLARAGIGQEQKLTTVKRVLTDLPYITSLVGDGPVGYATLVEYNRPSGNPFLMEVNINPRSPTVGETEEIATFPVSQLSIAETPESVVEAQQER